MKSEQMTVTLSDELVKAAQTSEAELKVEFALLLFQQDRLTLGQAAQLAQVPQLEFQRILAARRIPIHYGMEELQQDLARVRELPVP